MIVVIDHHVAHVYQDLNEKVPESEHTVHPYDPFGFHHHLIHKKEAHYKGERVPEEKSFYEEVAQDLLPADEIVLIGHGTGKSNAADHLFEYLKKSHHDISSHVIATENADLSALTEPEIEAIAKRHRSAVV
jgi:stalled ribosome rescue protein Dom34